MCNTPNKNTKVCYDCGKELPVESFRRRRRGGTSRQGRCQACYNAYMRAYRAARRSGALSRFSRGIQNERSVQRAAALCAGMLAKFGGVDGFCRTWKAQFDVMPPGSRDALDTIWAMLSLAGLCDRQGA